jgi:hypothetical protein
MNNPNINKRLYKILLSFVKYIPITLSIIFIIQNFLVYANITNHILLYLGGSSCIFIVLLYLLSWVFQFCYLYRIPLHYVVVSNIIGMLDSVFRFPISNIGMLRIYFILFGITLIVYIWLMYKNRNKPKIDPIKQLCETYCDCNC